MTDEMQEIRQELREIRELLTAPAPRPDDFVDAHYIHQRTGLSVETIKDGKAGTNTIPRVTLKSDAGTRSVIRYPRGAVDKWLRDRCREAVESMPKARALELVQRKLRRRRA
jgi:hypothetical protein